MTSNPLARRRFSTLLATVRSERAKSARLVRQAGLEPTCGTRRVPAVGRTRPTTDTTNEDNSQFIPARP
jgi:hypothetical protein